MVNFDGNGGDGTITPQSANSPTALSLNTFSYSGHTFMGWNSAANGSGTAYADGAEYRFGLGDDSTFFAQWAIKVTYFVNGGSGSVPIDPHDYTSDATATALAQGAITNEGYTFGGWNTQADGGGTSYGPGEIIAVLSDTALYAVWTAIGDTDNVTYSANGGSGPVPIDATFYVPGVTTAARAKGLLAKAGLVFTGWNTAANGSGTNYAPGETFVVSTDVTLYAQWAVGVSGATVTFNTAGGSSLAPVTGSVGRTIVLVTPTRFGYNFKGWFSAASGGILENRSYVVGRTVTLYAHWSLGASVRDLSTVVYSFATNKATLTPTMIQDIAAFAALIVQHHLTKISVIGFADIYGKSAANLVLGLGRAKAVRALLLADIRRLAPTLRVTLTVISKGNTVLPASNSTAAGRAFSRQVQIIAKP
jgi:uncharacterized repeat protein (TIGR02543 family)